MHFKPVRQLNLAMKRDPSQTCQQFLNLYTPMHTMWSWTTCPSLFLLPLPQSGRTCTTQIHLVYFVGDSITTSQNLRTFYEGQNRWVSSVNITMSLIKTVYRFTVRSVLARTRTSPCLFGRGMQAAATRRWWPTTTSRSYSGAKSTKGLHACDRCSWGYKWMEAWNTQNSFTNDSTVL